MPINTQDDRKVTSLRVHKTAPIICGGVYERRYPNGTTIHSLCLVVEEAPNGRRTGHFTLPNRGSRPMIENSDEFANYALVSAPEALDRSIEAEFDKVVLEVEASPDNLETTRRERQERVAQTARQFAGSGKAPNEIAKLLGVTLAEVQEALGDSEKVPVKTARGKA